MFFSRPRLLVSKLSIGRSPALPDVFVPLKQQHMSESLGHNFSLHGTETMKLFFPCLSTKFSFMNKVDEDIVSHNFTELQNHRIC